MSTEKASALHHMVGEEKSADQEMRGVPIIFDRCGDWTTEDTLWMKIEFAWVATIYPALTIFTTAIADKTTAEVWNI